MVRTGGEHHLRRFRGDLLTGLRRAGLHDHRPALDRARDVQRAAHREILALVAQHMQPVGSKKMPVLDVQDKGIVGPAVPQSGHHIIKLAAAR